MRAEWRYVVADSGYEGPDWVRAGNPSTAPSYLCALGQVTKPRGVLSLSMEMVIVPLLRWLED